MVIYNQIAEQDLIDILYGLITWEKHILSDEHCERYVDEIADVIDTICKKTFHRKCVLESHLKYGTKVFTYRRNKNTVWYFIYNWDNDNRIAYLNKIMNNHITKL
jgi:hypothetical protein